MARVKITCRTIDHLDKDRYLTIRADMPGDRWHSISWVLTGLLIRDPDLERLGYDMLWCRIQCISRCGRRGDKGRG